jgi:hypothetical protein
MEDRARAYAASPYCDGYVKSICKEREKRAARDQFIKESELLRHRLSSWKTQMGPALEDSRYLVTDFTNAPAVDPDDIINPYTPVIYSGPLWPMNFVLVD